MNSPSNIGRNQRPKMLKVKLAFQIVSLLAFCLWLLYQAKHSYDKDYSRSVHDRVSKGHGSDVLGRKANVGGSNLAGESIKDEDPGGVLDRNVEEHNEEESVNKVNGDPHGNFGRHEGDEGKETEKETELTYKELNNIDDNSDIEVKGSNEAAGLDSLQEESFLEGNGNTQGTMSDHGGEKNVTNVSEDEFGEEKEQDLHVNNDEQGNERDIEEETKTKESSTNDNKVLLQPTERKSDSLQGTNSMVEGVHGFDDETGVPVDGHDTIESTLTGSSGDGEIGSHEEMYISSNYQSETNGSTESEEIVVSSQ